MSFFEDIIADFVREVIFSNLKRIGIYTKWLLFFGGKPISELKKQKYNAITGLLFLAIVIAIIILLAY
jgi:hypothetical protein